MSRPPYQTYPHHHPHHGKPYIVVNDHDVLCGRGVNISQHPGNERFRALVNTRTDESYCTSFTTSEKRALAEEIIKHIQSLDPPGRFLKRSGRSQSSRGLNGPWEELSHKECIKKACQALRDCNRTDRSGYAAQVAIPEDVKENAEVRASTGLSLKEHAAAQVAKSKPASLQPHVTNLDQMSSPDFHDGSPMSDRDSRKRHSNEMSLSSSSENLVDSVASNDEWIKRQRTDESNPEDEEPVPTEADISALSIIHSTPAPYVAPVPVTSTPSMHHYAHNHSLGINSDTLPHHPPSPHMPSPTIYHHDPHEITSIHANVAPYSPEALLAPHEAHVDVDDIGHPEQYILDGTDFPDHVSYSHHDPHLHHFHHYTSHSHSDILQSAADAASALGHNPAYNNGYLLSGDDATQGSLGISDAL